MLAAVSLLVDTDPGRFSDDTAAIIMCLRSPERVSVRGVTVVSGNVWAQDGASHAQHWFWDPAKMAVVHDDWGK